MFPPKSCVFSRVPQIDDLALAADGFLPGTGPESTTLPSRIRYGTPLGQGALSSCSRSPRRAGRQHLDHLIEVPVRRGLRQPEAAAKPRDIALIPEPRQGEQCLPVASLGLRVPPASRPGGGGRPAARRRTRSDPWARRAWHDGRDHAEPSPKVAGVLQRDFFCRGSSASLTGDLRLCPRVCPQTIPLRHVCRTRPCWENLSAIPGMLYVLYPALGHGHGLRMGATYLYYLSRITMDYLWLDASSPCPNGKLPQDFFGFSSLRYCSLLIRLATSARLVAAVLSEASSARRYVFVHVHG